MDLSIIVVNWNTQDLLAQCLNSVKADLDVSNVSAEIIVVDNASTDDSPRMLKQHFWGVTLIENKKNIGFAAANNQAIKQSTGRYILLLNPDTIVESKALQILVEFLDTHPQAGAAGSQLLNPDGTLQTSCYPFPTLAREFWRLFHLDTLWPIGVYTMEAWNPDSSREVDVIQGAALMLRRETLDQVGLLDDEYFMYTEEVDLCYRIQAAEWKLYWVPQSKVIHLGGQSASQAAAKMFICLYQSKLVFFRKHYGRTAAQFYRLILFFASLFRLCLTPFVWLKQSPERQRHLTLANNYRRLLMELPYL